MTNPSFSLIRSTTVALIIGFSALGCATTDAPLPKQTSFEDLHKRILSSYPQAAAWHEVGHITPLALKFAATDPSVEVRVQKDFSAWCENRHGTFYSKKNLESAPSNVEKAFRISLVVLKGTKGLTPAPLACQADGDIHVLRRAASDEQASRIAWLAPTHLAAAQAVIRKMEADRKEADKKREETENGYRDKQYAKANAAKAEMLKNAKRGDTLACTGSVLAQGMSAPLTRAPLECRGLTVYMQELLSSGWTIAHQSQTPDGDFGGVARTLFNLMFVRK